MLDMVLFSTHDHVVRSVDELKVRLNSENKVLDQEHESCETFIDESQCLEAKLKVAMEKAWNNYNDSCKKLAQDEVMLKVSLFS